MENNFKIIYVYMYNWITLLCTWSIVNQLYFNRIYIYIYIKKKQTRGCQELRWEGWKGGAQEVREAAVSSVTPSRWTRDTVYPQIHRTRTWNRVNIMLTVDFSWVQCVHADSLVYQMQHTEKGTQVSIGGGSCMEGSCWGPPPLSARVL